MQLLDPTGILLLGVIVAVVFLVYAARIRHSGNPMPKDGSVSSMAGGRVDLVTTGAVQEPMLEHLVSVEEEREEQEGEDL
jgi:hypothetical protein